MSSHNESKTEASENWDGVFKGLSAGPRRRLLLSLSDVPPDQSVPLPQHAMKTDSTSDPEAVRRELYHVHLPVLEELGFVTSESEPLAAARGPQFEQVAAVLDSVESEAANLPDSLVVGCQRLEAEQ